MGFLFLLCWMLSFFFMQKSAYVVRISDWSSYVCSSDLDCDASEALLEQVNHALNSATALRIQGGNSKAFLGRKVEGEVLDTRAHRGIVSYRSEERRVGQECVRTCRSGW